MQGASSGRDKQVIRSSLNETEIGVGKSNYLFLVRRLISICLGGRNSPKITSSTYFDNQLMVRYRSKVILFCTTRKNCDEFYFEASNLKQR